jgi:hypothetical protein
VGGEYIYQSILAVISRRRVNPRGEAGRPRARAHAAAYGESLVEASNSWPRECAVLGAVKL